MKTHNALTKLAALAIITTSLTTQPAEACTGITLRPSFGGPVLARTIEWGGSDLGSMWVVVPRGYAQHTYLPVILTPAAGTPSAAAASTPATAAAFAEGAAGASTPASAQAAMPTLGMEFAATYGYVGLAVQQKEFVAEGLNEKGLSAGLFYFPAYGQYETYDPACADNTISDLQLVSWVLGKCASVEEVIEAVSGLHIVGIDPRASTVHWRFADTTGRQIVLEIIDGRQIFHENQLGVLTNSPSFDWQMTNLNNYVNLFPGSAPSQTLGNVQLAQFGAGSGFLGIPGDVTPPSRFVRAAFYQATAPVMANADAAVLQAFQILNNFDIPVGIEVNRGHEVPDIPSATQWTSATDIAGGKIYWRTMHNSAIRCIDLSTINFDKVKYRAELLDTVKSQPITHIKVR